MCFEEPHGQERTDASFKNRRDPEHHKYDSVMEKIIKMISQIPIDSMHLIKGIAEKLMGFYLGLSRLLSVADKNKINKRLRKLRDQQPSEFGRLIRELGDLSYWKACEFRTFVLYSGPIVLKGILPEIYYRNFLKFSMAFRIFSHPQLSHFVEFGEKLANDFVNEYMELFPGETVFNVHVFTHLGEDVRRHGPCDRFSCFQYESFLYSVKEMIHTPNLPIIQIFNRIHEILETAHIPSIKNSKYANRKVNIKGLKLDSSSKNCWVQLTNGDVFMCEQFEKRMNDPEKLIILGKRAVEKVAFFEEPFNSLYLDIFKVSKTAFSNQEEIEVSQIYQKLFGYSKTDYYIFSPISNIDD
jgi:hypothetical protein